MKDRKARDEQEEPASWLMTFGDLATLLLTFYVLIYASCTYKPGQWETARSALERILAVLPGQSGATLIASEGDGVLSGQTAIIPVFGIGGKLSSGDWKGLADAIDEMVDLADQDLYRGQVEIEPTEKGVVFRVAEPIAFSIGSAALNLEIRPILESIAKIIRMTPSQVIVEGHTCDLPIRTARYASNWDLSGARSAEVVRFFLEQGIGEASISARACGEYYPRTANVGESARRRNRRVEIQVTFTEIL